MLNQLNKSLLNINSSINAFNYVLYISRLKLPIRSILKYIDNYNEDLKNKHIQAPLNDLDIQARLDSFVNSTANEYEQMIKDESVKYYKKPIGDMSIEHIKFLSEQTLKFLDSYDVESLSKNKSINDTAIKNKIQFELNQFIEATIKEIRNKP